MTCEGISVPATQSEFEEQLKGFEGNIKHMYLDTAGQVTIGVGIMLPDEASAARLVFVNRETGEPASAPEIEADYASVKLAPPGKPASFYKSLTKLDGDKDSLEIEFKKRLESAAEDARAFLPNFDNLLAGADASVAYAIWDMAFNLGRTKLMRFVNFRAALDTEDWAKAAVESHRRGIQEARNEAISCWILKAVQPEGEEGGPLV